MYADLLRKATVAEQRELMTAREAATYLGVAEQTLSNWRYRNTGPPFYKLGNLVKYDRADLDGWLEEHRHEGHESAGMA